MGSVNIRWLCNGLSDNPETPNLSRLPVVYVYMVVSTSAYHPNHIAQSFTTFA